MHDSGGAARSQVPDGALPGSALPGLRVQVAIDSGDDLDVSRLDAIVSAAKPAHVPHSVNVVTRQFAPGDGLSIRRHWVF